MLYDLLEKLPSVMNPGGRIAILTFHSGEALRKEVKEKRLIPVAKDVRKWVLSILN